MQEEEAVKLTATADSIIQQMQNEANNVARLK